MNWGRLILPTQLTLFVKFIIIPNLQKLNLIFQFLSRRGQEFSVKRSSKNGSISQLTDMSEDLHDFVYRVK